MQTIDKSDIPQVKSTLRRLKATGFKFSPITRTKFPSTVQESSKFYAANCEKLAALLEGETSIEFNMARWGIVDLEDHACGTVGCALGTAAMSGRFAGLQYRIDARALALGDTRGRIDAVVNGEDTEWEAAGVQFFGHHATIRVFLVPYLNKQEVIDRLRVCAANYRAGIIL